MVERLKMHDEITCIRCHSRMEIDYIADVTYGAYLQQNPGEPKLGFWKRLKVRGTNSFQSERSDALIVAI